MYQVPRSEGFLMAPREAEGKQGWGFWLDCHACLLTNQRHLLPDVLTDMQKNSLVRIELAGSSSQSLCRAYPIAADLSVGHVSCLHLQPCRSIFGLQSCLFTERREGTAL